MHKQGSWSVQSLQNMTLNNILILKHYEVLGCHLAEPCNYCKGGYFCWGKISRKCWQDISRGGNFHDTTPISFIKAYGFYFCVGVIFAKKTKMQKLPPRKNLQYNVILLFTSVHFVENFK